MIDRYETGTMNGCEARSSARGKGRESPAPGKKDPPVFHLGYPGSFARFLCVCVYIRKKPADYDINEAEVSRRERNLTGRTKEYVCEERAVQPATMRQLSVADSPPRPRFSFSPRSYTQLHGFRVIITRRRRRLSRLHFVFLYIHGRRIMNRTCGVTRYKCSYYSRRRWQNRNGNMNREGNNVRGGKKKNKKQQTKKNFSKIERIQVSRMHVFARISRHRHCVVVIVAA